MKRKIPVAKYAVGAWSDGIVVHFLEVAHFLAGNGVKTELITG